MSTFDEIASQDWPTVWAIKWTDVSQGYHFPCVRRFSTQKGALAFKAEFDERVRLFYTGIMSAWCPFQDVRIIHER